MKLKSIEIKHMHKIADSAKYDLNDITYFIGQNGAGKSTILQAIQLALLGYIPGYDKTNAGILKHSSDGQSIAVIAEFDDGSSINRTWMKDKSSVKNTFRTVPENLDMKSVIGNIELPIFNFAEFKNMTANKLKEWFISFLPKEEFEIEWKEYLTSELGSRSALLSDDLMEQTLSYIAEDLADKSGVDLVKGLNEWLKGQQSFEKSQIDRLQSTINSMIYYVEAENADENEIRSQITEKQKLKDALIKYEAQQQSLEKIKEDLERLGNLAENVESDLECMRLEQEISDCTTKLNSINSMLAEKGAEYAKLSAELMQYSNIASDICPYTHQTCAEMSNRLEEATHHKAEISAKMNELTAEQEPLSREAAELTSKINGMQFSVNNLSEKYHLAAVLRNQLTSLTTIEKPSSESIDMLTADLIELENTLVKISANKQFNELNNTITKEKYKSENAVEVLKVWVNSTGANGLQTYMMQKPFELLAADMSAYLSSMFGQDTKASFHLEEKANSFSFGILRNDSYIEFDLLSSGEKCLFTIALMMCLIHKSSTDLKLILADDILDHLDAENAERFFSGVQNSDIQFVMAGVKECNDTSICVEV